MCRKAINYCISTNALNSLWSSLLSCIEKSSWVNVYLKSESHSMFTLDVKKYKFMSKEYINFLKTLIFVNFEEEMLHIISMENSIHI